jgi:hypothetical protein
VTVTFYPHHVTGFFNGNDEMDSDKCRVQGCLKAGVVNIRVGPTREQELAGKMYDTLLLCMEHVKDFSRGLDDSPQS